MSFGSDGLGEPAGAELDLPVEGDVDDARLIEDTGNGASEQASVDDGLVDLEIGQQWPPPALNEDKLSSQQVAALRIDPTVDVYAPDLDKALAHAALERKWKVRFGGAITSPLRAVLRTVLEQLTGTCGVSKKELSEYVAAVLAE